MVEDDAGHCKTLVGYIHDFMACGDEAYECRAFEDGTDFLAQEPDAFGIVFLDIMMARSNGIDVARKLRESNEAAAIVFVTEAVQYALDGYGVRACDFLIKPLYYTSFCNAMQRALASVRKAAPKMVRIEFDKTTSLMDVSSIYLVETRSKGTLVHTQSGDYPCADSLRQMEEKLAPFGFGRCHQAYLVNVAFVETVRKAEVLVHGAWLPLSRSKREHFLELLMKQVGATI